MISDYKLDEIPIPQQPIAPVYVEHTCPKKPGREGSVPRSKLPDPPRQAALRPAIDRRWIVGHCGKCGKQLIRRVS